MERMLVAIFDDEVKAQEASKSLQRMGDEGVIAVHTVRVFTRQRDGFITTHDVSDSLPEGTMGGTAVGSLLGLLGGPLGLAIGAAGGMLIGATADYAKARVTADFAQHVAGGCRVRTRGRRDQGQCRPDQSRTRCEARQSKGTAARQD